MIEKILSNPDGFRELLLAAQSLVNEQFNINAKKLGAEIETVQSINIQNFKKTVTESILLTKEEKEKFDNDNDAYQLAREIILQFTAQEIKSPLK